VTFGPGPVGEDTAQGLCNTRLPWLRSGRLHDRDWRQSSCIPRNGKRGEDGGGAPQDSSKSPTSSSQDLSSHLLIVAVRLQTLPEASCEETSVTASESAGLDTEMTLSMVGDRGQHFKKMMYCHVVPVGKSLVRASSAQCYQWMDECIFSLMKTIATWIGNLIW